MTNTTGHVAVIDIGKTNAKLALVALSDLSEIAVRTRPNHVLTAPSYPHFDTEQIWEFLLDALTKFHAAYGIDAISVTTHGACAALLGTEGGLATPILDYEHDGPDGVAQDYDALRPTFDQTRSPRLAMGLNLGAQLYWLFRNDPTLLDRTATIVTYPQYWGHRLTGVAATDMTSLGCHTDLWNPHEGRFSALVERLGITDRIAPARRPGEVIGPILPAIAARTGLRPETPVLCGIHHSNASLLPHVLGNRPPYSLVSTGTWVIAMAIGGQPVAPDPARDMLINVNALGQPVSSARFLGGREHDLIAGDRSTEVSEEILRAVLVDGPMLLPAVEPGSGPFRGRQARWIGTEPAAGSPERYAALALYLALVTEVCLSGIGHQGRIIVEGPFAANRPYLRMRVAATGCAVSTSRSATGTSQGAAQLWRGAALKSPEAELPFDPMKDAFIAYGVRWTQHVNEKATA